MVRLIKHYEAVGLAGPFNKPRSGRPRRLTPEYEAKLIEAVKQEPRSLGLPFASWTTANLADHMAQQTRIKITPGQVENYLKAHGWRLRRPVRTVEDKQGPDLVEEKKRIADSKAQAGTGQLILLFADAAEVSLYSTIMRCWTEVGGQRVIVTPSVRAAKRWDSGAVDPVTDQMVQVIRHRRNNVGFRRLLGAISGSYDLPNQPERQVILFMERAANPLGTARHGGTS